MEEHLESIKEGLTLGYERLEESKRVGLLVHAAKRLFEVEGLDLAGLLALELFTTIIPLILLGFGWASHFNANLSFGDFMIKWMDLKGATAEQVHNLFGVSADLKSTWTVAGIAGFLFWGIPMSSQVAKTYARAFRRERWPFWTEVWRGTAWFLVLLGSSILTYVITRHHDRIVMRIATMLLGSIPTFVLWSVAPFILVRNGTRGWRHMAWGGLAGVILDLVGVRITLRWVFPKLLAGWVSFGPIGAAMALMTTCTVIAVLWVGTACLGAVLWERTAPADTVIDAQRDGNNLRAQVVGGT